MAELKTKQTDESVVKFLNTIEDLTKRKDCFEIAEMMKRESKCEPKMWGASIIGFGSYHYKYESGHEGDACLIGFSPRKQNITLYMMGGINNHEDLLKKLGKYKKSKGCLYINKLSDIDTKVLKEIVKISFDSAKNKHR
jgi:Domain of unknown function (DU1801)